MKIRRKLEEIRVVLINSNFSEIRSSEFADGSLVPRPSNWRVTITIFYVKNYRVSHMSALFTRPKKVVQGVANTMAICTRLGRGSFENFKSIESAFKTDIQCRMYNI